MRDIAFQPDAFNEFIEISKEDKNLFKKIVNVIFETQRNPFSGLSKPGPLKHNYKGYWSRHITDEHRLVYKVTESSIIIISCKYHY